MPRDRRLVLIVEDESLRAMNLQMLVEDAGYRTTFVASREDVNRVLEDQTPAVATLDLRLRDGLSGPSIAEVLIDRHVGVVVYSGEPEGIVRHLPIGGHVQKTSSPDLLIKLIHRAAN